MYKWYYDPCSCKTNKDLAELLSQLEKEINDIQKDIGQISKNTAVAASAMTHVNFQYIIYMNLYGYPEDGVWNETLLQEIYDQYKDG